jgi:hypothetical protein
VAQRASFGEQKANSLEGPIMPESLAVRRAAESTSITRVREVLDLTRLSSILPLANDMASGLALLRGSASAHNAR